MSKIKLFVIILASLLFGAVATLGTSHNERRHVAPAADCGYSIDGKTGAHVTLTACQLARYGWPRPYLLSNMQVVLKDYHAPTTGQLNQLTGSAGSARLDESALLLDILVWSLLGLALGALVVAGFKKARRPSPPAAPIQK